MDFVRYMTRVYYICTIIVHYYNMKNNYSKRLMDVIEYSREEAARLQNSYIGPEHLMLGIIRDGEGKAVQALRELNVDEWDIKRKIELEIKNTGSSLLKDIQLSANKPVDWDVAFEPSKIEMLKAGETATAVAILKASKKALPGDYVTTMMAKTPEVNADAQFRIAVKTPMIWGWVGVLIILATIGVVYYLFRKYGRR